MHRYWLVLLLLLSLPGFAQGLVFHDRNRNGLPDPGEEGLAGVPVSDGRRVVLTDRDGGFHLPEGGLSGPVFVSPPSGWWTDRFWLPPGDELYFGLYAIAEPEEFSFIQVTDIHLIPEAADNLRQFVDAVNSLPEPPAFVVATGDLIMAGDRYREPRQLEAAFTDYLALMAALEVPLFNVLGNHDCACALPREHPYWHKGAYRALLGPSWYSFNYGGWHFVVLDTNSPSCPTWEAIPQEQLYWLEQDLAVLPPATPLVLFSHVPLFLCQNFQGLLKAVSGHEVKVAAAGHLHATDEIVVRFPQVVTGALCGSWWGKGGLSWQGSNPDGSPQGYRLFEVVGEDIYWQYIRFP